MESRATGLAASAGPLLATTAEPTEREIIFTSDIKGKP